MGAVELEEKSVTRLDKMESDRGKVLHGMRKTDVGYCRFGEVYFSVVYYEVVGR